MGHPNQVVLDMVLRSIKMVIQPNNSYSFYNAYKMSKSYRLSLNVIYHRSVISFKIVHIDIWGTSLVITSNIIRYIF